MTSRWNLGEQPEQTKEEQEDIEGTFYCQRDECDEAVDKAVYLPAHKLLTWKCANGHKSYIEDISL